MGVVTVVDERLTVVRQSQSSLAHFGDQRGRAWDAPFRRHVDGDAWRTRMVSVEQVRADGGVVRLASATSEWSVRDIGDGELLLTWRPLIEEPPAEFGLVARMDLLAEHLDHLSWALREGRPLPHVPAALRRGVRPPGT